MRMPRPASRTIVQGCRSLPPGRTTRNLLGATHAATCREPPRPGMAPSRRPVRPHSPEKTSINPYARACQAREGPLASIGRRGRFPLVPLLRRATPRREPRFSWPWPPVCRSALEPTPEFRSRSPPRSSMARTDRAPVARLARPREPESTPRDWLWPSSLRSQPPFSTRSRNPTRRQSGVRGSRLDPFLDANTGRHRLPRAFARQHGGHATVARKPRTAFDDMRWDVMSSREQQNLLPQVDLLA